MNKNLIFENPWDTLHSSENNSILYCTLSKLKSSNEIHEGYERKCIKNPISYMETGKIKRPVLFGNDFRKMKMDGVTDIDDSFLIYNLKKERNVIADFSSWIYREFVYRDFDHHMYEIVIIKC